MVEEDLPFPVDVELLSAERSKAGRGRSHAVRLQLGVQVQPCARRYTPARRFWRWKGQRDHYFPRRAEFQTLVRVAREPDFSNIA